MEAHNNTILFSHIATILPQLIEPGLSGDIQKLSTQHNSIHVLIIIIQFSRKKNKTEQQSSQVPIDDIPSVLWLNSLVGRILFDCLPDPTIKEMISSRLQRKLSSIKLPYFVEEIILTELVLGSNMPYG